MKEFYENLKKKRLEKGISLEEIHRRSRLSMTYLKALEAGEVDKLPKGYERIYLRRYAKEVGLDMDEVSRDFDLVTGRLKPPASAGTVKEPPQPAAVTPEVPPEAPPTSGESGGMRAQLENLNLDRLHKILWPVLGAILVISAGVVVYQQYFSAERGRNVEIKEIPITELIARAEPEETAPLPAGVPDSAATSPEAAMTIELVAKERVWVREVRDNRDTTEYIMITGLRRSISAASQVELILGRADGVEILLNGTSLGPLGEADQVASLVITPQGIARKRLRTVLPPSSDSLNQDSAMVSTSE